MTLTKKQLESFDKIINDAYNSELYELMERLAYEIKLSNECIAEGEEELR